MENEYGITVTNKYSLFLSGDEDLLQVLQRELESKPTSKKEKQKKPPGREKEIKLSQANFSGNEQPKLESVDQFTSPTSGDEPTEKQVTPSEPQFEQPKPGKQVRERTRPPRGGQVPSGNRNSASERPPRMNRDQFRSNRIDRAKDVGIGNGTTSGRQTHKDVFANSSQRLDGPVVENKPDEMGSSSRTERGYFGERPPRRGGYRGRRMNRGGFLERLDRNRFEDRDRDNRNGFNSHGISNEHSDNMSDRVDRNDFRGPRDQRGRRGWRGRGGYRRPMPRASGVSRGSHSDSGPAELAVSAPAESAEIEPEHDKETVEKDGAGTWAEQLEAAEQAAKVDEQSAVDAGDAASSAKEEEKVMTLDEWKAQEDVKRAKADFNIRKPGEGCNGDPQWNKMVVLSKKEKTEDAEDEEELEEERHGVKTRNLLPIEIHFADESMRGRGHGTGRPYRGRGGRFAPDRGRGDYSRTYQGRGGYGEHRPYRRGRGIEHRREYTPNFEDEMDFPSLDKSHGPA